VSDDTFLSRWAKRKAAVREGRAQPPEPVLPPPVAPASLPVVAPVASAESAERPDTSPPPPSQPAEPLPTLEDVATLTPGSDFTRFIAPNVDPAVKNAAMKKLFADPHFNVMDGLDTYIDDYGKPDPIPLSMLKRMAQSHVLGLFAEQDDQPTPPHDQDSPVRLQSHDAPGPADAPTPGPSAVPDAGREP
jgi:Protein of unknown function (DUF3306)